MNTKFDPVAQSSVGLRQVLSIMGKWGLNDAQQDILLGIPEPTLLQRRTQVREGQLDQLLAEDTRLRVSYLLGIWKATVILLPTQHVMFMKNANTNEPFGGRSPLQRMLLGGMEDLAATPWYLDGCLEAG